MSILLLNNDKSKLFFEYFGLVVFSYAAIKLFLRVINNVGSFFFGTGSVNFRKYGTWAVVTGCTDGIGKAYVDRLAMQGLNIVLISRSLDKLQQQEKELKEKHNIETLVISADFTEPNSIYPIIKSKISELDIAVLVNNVGISYSYPEYFGIYAQNDKAVTDMINANITSLTKMTAIVLPNMVKKSKGVIINNASASGRIPTPFLTIYSASKAYVDFFSRALDIEYRSKGIIVQSLCPYFVSTKLSQVRSSYTAPKPNSYVRDALNTIASQPVTNGCIPHNIQGWLFENVIPRSIFNKMTSNILLSARSRALKKIQKKEQEAQKKD